MIAERLTSQLLSGPPARDAAAVAERLVAVQAQDRRGARLAVRARTSGGTAADVDRALTVDRSLVVSWLNRGTLHLVRSEDFWWLHALTTPPLATACRRRLEQEGVSPAAAERGIETAVQALSEHGPLTRAQLRERIDAAGVRTAGQALVHLLFLAALRGCVVRGPMVGPEQKFVLAADWLGPAPEVDRDRALASLARRYLAGHGPAGDRDLAKWSGLGLRDVRRALAAIAEETVETPDGLMMLADRAAAASPPPPPPRLLGAFDPLLLGWASREPVVAAHAGRLVTDNGLFRPFALVDGRAVGTWRIDGARIVLSPFARLRAHVVGALERDGADVAAFLALPAYDGLSLEPRG